MDKFWLLNITSINLKFWSIVPVILYGVLIIYTIDYSGDSWVYAPIILLASSIGYLVASRFFHCTVPVIICDIVALPVYSITIFGTVSEGILNPLLAVAAISTVLGWCLFRLVTFIREGEVASSGGQNFTINYNGKTEKTKSAIVANYILEQKICTTGFVERGFLELEIISGEKSFVSIGEEDHYAIRIINTKTHGHLALYKRTVDNSVVFREYENYPGIIFTSPTAHSLKTVKLVAKAFIAGDEIENNPLFKNYYLSVPPTVSE